MIVFILGSSLIYLYVQTLSFYKNYQFKSEVDELITSKNVVKLYDMYSHLLFNPHSDSLNYLIINSFFNPNRFLKKEIEKDFSSFSENIKDSIVNYCLYNRIPFFSEIEIYTYLYEQNFIINEKMQQKIINTHPAEKLINYINGNLKIRLVDLSDKTNIHELWKLRKDIRGYRSTFSLTDDQLWQRIEVNLNDLYSLFVKLKEIKCDKPREPNYYEPHYDGPEYLYGGVMPYDGAGLLIYSPSDLKYKIILGVSKDPIYMFEGYGKSTGETTSIISYSNRSTWDAEIYNYKTRNEYNEAVLQYQIDVNVAREDYQKSSKEYNIGLFRYNTYLKEKKILGKDISVVIERLGLLIEAI